MRIRIAILSLTAALAAGAVHAQTLGDATKGKTDFAVCGVLG